VVAVGRVGYGVQGRAPSFGTFSWGLAEEATRPTAPPASGAVTHFWVRVLRKSYRFFVGRVAPVSTTLRVWHILRCPF
jgi:hypothetical protein